MRTFTKGSKGEKDDSKTPSVLRTSANDPRFGTKKDQKSDKSNRSTDREPKGSPMGSVNLSKATHHYNDSVHLENSKRSSFSKDFVNIEANDIVLDLPTSKLGSDKYIVDPFNRTMTDSNRDSPALTRAMHKAQQNSRKIQDLNKYRSKFENSYVHNDSSNRLKLEKEKERPNNQKHFVNVIDNPQLAKKQLAEMKVLAKQVDSIMQTSWNADDSRQQDHQVSLLHSIAESREKKAVSMLQMMAEKNIAQVANSVTSRAEANYNVIKRRMMSRDVTDAALADILKNISADISRF